MRIDPVLISYILIRQIRFSKKIYDQKLPMHVAIFENSKYAERVEPPVSLSIIQ